MSNRLNLDFHLGETWDFDFVAMDHQGNALDLTGATVRWRLANSTEAFVQVNAEIVSLANSICRVKVLPTQQGLVRPRMYRHEAHVTLASGDIYVQIVGEFLLKASLFALPVSNADGGIPYGITGRWLGAFDASDSYSAYDIVYFEGSSYIAKAAIEAGVEPGSDVRWEVVALSGELSDQFDSDSPGVVPASGGGTDNFLRADGEWATPPNPSLFDASTPGIVPASGGGVDSFLRADGVFAPVIGYEGDIGTFAKMGGSTASFPALKRSAGELHVRLADDSSFADLKLRSLLFADGTTMSTASAGGGGSFSGDLGTFATMGGATASFPALKRVGTGLEVRLADDSGFATLQVGALSVAGLEGFGSLTSSYGTLHTSSHLTVNGTLSVGANLAVGPIGAPLGYLWGVSSNTFGIHNQTNPSTFLVYGSTDNDYTDGPANFSRLSLKHTGLGATIATEAGGTGIAGPLTLIASRVNFGGTTSSFPALNVSGFELQVLRADGSQWGAFRAGSITTDALSSWSHIYFLENSGFLRFGATQDAGVGRNAAGVVEINNGTLGQYGDLLSRSLFVGGLGGGEIKLRNSGNFQLEVRNGDDSGYSNIRAYGVLIDNTVTWNGGSSLNGATTNVLSLLNSTNAQTFRIYGSDGGTNYSRLKITHAGGTAGATIATEAGGTGTAGGLTLQGGTQFITLDGNGAKAAFNSSNYYNIGNQIEVTLGGTISYWMQSTTLGMRSDGALAWANGASANNTKDTGLSRNTAGVVEINNGTLGQYRDLVARNVKFGGSASTDVLLKKTANGELSVRLGDDSTVGSLAIAFLNTGSGGFTGSMTGSSDAKFLWGTTGWWTTPDTGLARKAAGVVEVNNGTAGTYRDIIARYHTIGGTSNDFARLECSAGSYQLRVMAGDGSSYTNLKFNSAIVMADLALGDGNSLLGAPALNILHLQNGTSAQTVRIYGSLDSNSATPTNYSRLKITHGGGTAGATIATEKGGTGTAGPLSMKAGAAAAHVFQEDALFNCRAIGGGSGTYGGLPIYGGQDTHGGGGTYIELAYDDLFGIRSGNITWAIRGTTANHGLYMRDTGRVSWGPSGSVPNATNNDTALMRNADGILEVNNGTAGTYRALRVAALENAQGTLTSGASVAWDVRANQSAVLTLGVNATLTNPTNPVAGTTYILVAKQAASGGPYTLAYDTNYKFPGDVVPTMPTTAGKRMVLTFLYDGTYMLGVSAQEFAA